MKNVGTSSAKARCRCKWLLFIPSMAFLFCNNERIHAVGQCSEKQKLTMRTTARNGAAKPCIVGGTAPESQRRRDARGGCRREVWPPRCGNKTAQNDRPSGMLHHGQPYDGDLLLSAGFDVQQGPHHKPNSTLRWRAVVFDPFFMCNGDQIVKLDSQKEKTYHSC